MSQKEKTFDEVYDELLPQLTSLEDLRKKWVKRARWHLDAALLLIGLFIVLTALELYVFLWILVILIPVCFANYDLKKGEGRKELAPLYKKIVVGPLLDFYFDKVSYIPKQKMNLGLLRDSLLFDKPIHIFKGEDFIECNILEKDIYLSEITAYNLIDDGMIFNGVFIAVLFNKRFNTKTIVLNRKKAGGARKVKMNRQGKMMGADRVKLENVEFDKQFLVVAEDQIEARYKLTPALMERMLDYKRKLNTDVSFSFVNNYLYVAINSTLNLFEPHLFKPLTDKDFVARNLVYFDLLTCVVEDLDLNTSIWA